MLNKVILNSLAHCFYKCSTISITSSRVSLLEQEWIAQLAEGGGSESWINALMLLNDKK